MKKYILTALAVFSLSALAEMNVAGQSESSEGFNGSVELKWRYVDGDAGKFTHRARAGWTGSVNDHFHFGVSFSSPVEAGFNTYDLTAIHLEQAYVKFAATEWFHLKGGKYEKHSGFNKYGILVDDDLYTEGVKAKFNYEVAPAVYFYAGVSAEKTGDNYAGLWGENDAVTSGWLGVKSDGDAWNYSVSAGVKSNKAFDGDKNLAVVKASVGAGDLGGVPAGAFGLWSSDVGELGAGTYTAGVYVGDASETHGWSVALSWYQVDADHWNATLIDNDYVAGTSETDEEGNTTVTAFEGSGVAVKAQYNPWDNTNFALKVNWAKDADDAIGAVGELTFNF